MVDPALPPQSPPAVAQDRPRRIGPLTTTVALVALALLSFVNATSGEFIYDDLPYVVDNPQVQKPSFERVFLEPLSGRAELGLHRPLPVLSYALQARGRGAGAPTWPFHAFNIACHAAVSLLVWRLALRLGLAPGAAAVAGGLFAIHPCHLEAVDWIVGRAELLAALFGTGFLLVALRGDGRRRLRDTALAALLLAAAGLSKESAFALPGVLVCIELALGRSARPRDLLARHLPWAAVLGALFLLRIEALGRFGPRTELAPYFDLAWHERAGVALNLLGEYFVRSLLPLPPRIFFHRSEFVGLSPAGLAGAAIWAAALAAAWRRPPLRAALVAFPVALIPVLNLWPIQETFAERFLYLPSAFPLMLAAAPLAGLVGLELRRCGRAGASLLAPGAVGITLLALTWSWNPIFGAALPLWRHNVARAPEIPFPHYQLAFFLHDRGIFTRRDAETPGALEEYETALRLNQTLLERGLAGMPVDQLIRTHLSIGSIHLERLAPARCDAARARVALDRAIEIGEAHHGLDRELGRAYWLFAQLRHFPAAGVDDELALRALDRARELDVRPELLEEIERDRERILGK